MKTKVLLIGLDPKVVDYASSPAPLDEPTLRAALEADEQQLRDLGYDAVWLLTDRGETAASVVSARLAKERFDCIPPGSDDRGSESWHSLAMRMTALLLLLAGCTASASGPGQDDGTDVVADGVHYRVLSSGKLAGQGWEGYAVKYNWSGALDGPTLHANADHLLHAFGPEAHKDGSAVLMVTAVFPGQSMQVNLGYEFVAGSWKEMKKP